RLCQHVLAFIATETSEEVRELAERGAQLSLAGRNDRETSLVIRADFGVRGPRTAELDRRSLRDVVIFHGGVGNGLTIHADLEGLSGRCDGISILQGKGLSIRSAPADED